MNDNNESNPLTTNTPIPSNSDQGFEPPSGTPVEPSGAVHPTTQASSSVSSNETSIAPQASTSDAIERTAQGVSANAKASSQVTPPSSNSPTTSISGIGATAATTASSAPRTQAGSAFGASATPSSQGSAGAPPTTTPVAAAAGSSSVANPIVYGKTRSSATSPVMIFLIAFAGALVACILALGVMFAFGAFNNSGSSVTLGSSTASNIESSDVDSTLAEAVASQCLPSVVSIDVYGTQSQSSGSSIYDYLYGFDGGSQSQELTEIGLGSGVIISEDGYIITNYHVIEGGQQYQVTVAGEQKEAELVGSDSSSDVAVLKIKDGGSYTAIQLGDSANISIGEWVMSIGSPFGLEQSVATGIISATSRSQIMDADTDMYGQSTGEVTIYPNMIQTDAAINPGNSGGALVNAQGQLVGINTLITSYSGNYSGVGFAIPSNYAISIAQSIIEGKEPTRAFLGITMTTVNSTAAKMYGFATDSGAYVSSVQDGSAAADAGIKVGDIIVGFDGETVSSASDVMLDVRTKNPGDKVSITLIRDNEEQTVEVTLGQTEESDSSSNGNSSDNSNGNSSGNEMPENGSPNGNSNRRDGNTQRNSIS